MSVYETSALSVTASTSVYARDTVTTAEAQRIPVAWHQGWITIEAEGQDVHVKWTVGTSATAASRTARSTMSGDDATAAAGGTIHIPAGTQKEFDLRNFRVEGNKRLYFSHISPATGGVIRWWRSSGPGN